MVRVLDRSPASVAIRLISDSNGKRSVRHSPRSHSQKWRAIVIGDLRSGSNGWRSSCSTSARSSEGSYTLYIVVYIELHVHTAGGLCLRA